MAMIITTLVVAVVVGLIVGGSLLVVPHLPIRGRHALDDEPTRKASAQRSGGPRTLARQVVIDMDEVAHIAPIQYGPGARQRLLTMLSPALEPELVDDVARDLVFSVLVWGGHTAIDMCGIHDSRHPLAPRVYAFWPYLMASVISETCHRLSVRAALRDHSGDEVLIECAIEVEQREDGEVICTPWLG